MVETQEHTVNINELNEILRKHFGAKVCRVRKVYSMSTTMAVGPGCIHNLEIELLMEKNNEQPD